MRVKLITLAFAPALGTIDDRPLAEFLRDKEVIAVREHFFVVHEVPYLACLVTYQDSAARVVEPPSASRAALAAEPELDPTARALYATLREWRNARAKRDGVPAYVLFTNAELARLARERPASLNALGAIEGIGPGKIRRYGTALLDELHGRDETPSAPSAAPVANAATIGATA